MGDMQGKVVAVTGAARGLGASLARQLTERGARVALLGLEPGELDAVSARCPGSRWWEVDVTNAAALNNVAQELQEHFGRLDALVMNAGVASAGPFLHADPAAYDRTIEINLLGSIRTLRAFLPALIASKGYALQIASLAALAPAPMLSAYCASKSGVEAFAETVRTELAWHGVDVGVAYLSWVDTDLVRGADEQPDIAKARSELPGVLGKTYPVEPSVAALVDGIERRAAHVYGQRWVRSIRPIRGLITGLLYAAGKRRVAKAEMLYLAAGPTAGHLVGAGGRADTERRSSKVTP
jgi:NAD(P)-dependent dehydrogenase (short-subunit alcohol dehydrogenase family)